MLNEQSLQISFRQKQNQKDLQKLLEIQKGIKVHKNKVFEDLSKPRSKVIIPKPFNRQKDRIYEMLRYLPFDTPGPVMIEPASNTRIIHQINASSRQESFFDEIVEQNEFKVAPNAYKPLSQATRLPPRIIGGNQQKKQMNQFLTTNADMISSQYYDPQPLQQDTHQYKVMSSKRRTIFDLQPTKLESMLSPSSYHQRQNVYKIIHKGCIRKHQIE